MDRSLPRLPARGDRVDRYRVMAEVAQGGMAAVYAIRRENVPGFEKILAMKVLLPQLAGERRFVDMFLDEARIAARVQHPNVVQIFDVIEHEGLPILVMEYLRGRSLADVLGARPPISQPLVVSALARAAFGLHAAHTATGENGEDLRIVHRDVSPQNVHVGYDGQVKLVDFGIAAARGRVTTTRTGEIKGKLGYLAPEQISHAYPIDRRVDLWALGVMAWEALVGRRLFHGDGDGDTLYAILNAAVPRVDAEVDGVPRTVVDVIAACLRRVPGDRPTTAAEVGEVLAAGADSEAIATAELAAFMASAFASERASEEERLTTAIRTTAPAKAELRADAAPPVATESLSSPPRRSRLRQATVASVIVAAAVTFGVASRPSARDAPATAAAPSNIPPPSVASRTVVEPPAVPDSAPNSRPPVTIGVDPRVRLVLVDGARRDERPLSIDLGEGGSASIDLVGPSGAIVHRTVTREDDGKVLAAEPAPSASPPRTRPRNAKAPAGSAPLLGNPY